MTINILIAHRKPWADDILRNVDIMAANDVVCDIRELSIDRADIADGCFTGTWLAIWFKTAMDIMQEDLTMQRKNICYARLMSANNGNVWYQNCGDILPMYDPKVRKISTGKSFFFLADALKRDGIEL